jgi:hypothetical protein
MNRETMMNSSMQSYFDPAASFRSSSNGPLTSTQLLAATLQEPSFFVPRMPDIIKVQEPMKRKAPLHPANDMKTLRKQYEFLQEEVQERTENYNAICYQNEQLWSYIQELLEANKGNAVKMKDYVKNLNEELRTVYRERTQYAEKLEMAKSTQQMLLDLNREFQEAQISNEELLKRRKDAQHELLRSKREKEDLETQLKDKLSQMTNYESMLDEFRLKKYEDETIEQADDFYFSNKVILKSAYQRFRKGVSKRLREEKIYQLFQGFYSSYLKRKLFEIWFYYLKIEKRSKQALKRRNSELVLLCFTKWKIFKALENLFYKSQRKLLLSTSFHYWILYLQDCRKEKQNLMRLEVYQNQQLKKSVFQVWKKEICFLSWYSSEIYIQEQNAKKYFKLKLFRNWKSVIEKTKIQERNCFADCTKIKTKYIFHNWFQLCHRLWKIRGKLLRKFFHNLKTFLGNNSYFQKARRQSLMYYVFRMKMKAWTKYRNWFLMKKRVKTILLKRSIKFLNKQQTALMKNNLYYFIKVLSCTKRQYLSYQMGKEHFKMKKCRSAFQVLKLKAERMSVAKRFYFQNRSGQVFQKLSKLMKLTKLYVRTFHKTNSFAKQITKLKLINALQKWFNYLTFFKQRKMIVKIINRKAMKRKFYVAWKIWKSTFAKVIFWKLRTSEIEKTKISSLNELMQDQLHSFKQELLSLKDEQNSNEKAINDLQELIENKNNLLNNSLMTIENQEKNKNQLENFITQLTHQLTNLEKEKVTWKLIESNYQKEKEKQMQERENKRRETMKQIDKLKHENKFLLSNNQQLSDQFQSKNYENESLVSFYSTVLDEKEKEKNDSLFSLQNSEMELKSLESDEESLNLELNKVQKKMKEINLESDNILRDNSKLLREKTSEVRILREDTGE